MPTTATHTTGIEEVAALLRECAAAFDPAAELASDLAQVVEVAAEIERLAAGMRLRAAARVAESGVWKTSGDRSADEWMARVTRTSIGQARAEIGTGSRLASMPRTAEAVRAGKLNPQQANEVTSAVYFAPDAETRLLEVADTRSLRDLKDAARAARQATRDDAARHTRIRRDRYLRTTTDTDGAFCLSMRGPASDGARLLAALRPFHAGHFDTNRRTGTHVPYEATAYDAMCTMAQAAHGHLPPPITTPHTGSTHGQEPPSTTSSEAGSARGQRSPSLVPAGPRCASVPATPETVPTDPPQDEHRSTLFADLDPPPDCAARSATRRAPAGPSDHPPRGTAPPDRISSPAERNATTAPPRGTSPPAEPNLTTTPPDVASPPGGASPPAATTALPAHECGADPPKPRLGGRDVKVIVRIDHTALIRGHPLDGETVDIAGVGPVPVAAVRELMPDASVAVVVTKGTDVHTVAHHGRGPSRAQLTALEWLMPTCTVAGCPCTIAIQYDHRRPWTEVFETLLTNLDGLCAHHHHLKTTHGYHLEPGTGPRRLLPPGPRA